MTVKAGRQHVLVVEDDSELRDNYKRFFDLHADEFAADIVQDGERALGILRGEPVDLLVLDWGLPGISGASLAKALRAHVRTRALGILMVTAHASASETVFALEAGADDHIAKPFDWSVLLARLRNLVRRRALTFDDHKAHLFPGLDFDTASETLKIEGVAVRLTPKETALLKVFLSRPGILHSQRFLWDAAWGADADGWERTLTVTISSLRKKLGPDWGPRLQTRSGKGGYVLEMKF